MFVHEDMQSVKEMDLLNIQYLEYGLDEVTFANLFEESNDDIQLALHFLKYVLTSEDGC